VEWEKNWRYQKLREILEGYLSNSYSETGLANILPFTPKTIASYLKNYSKIELYFGKDVVEALKQHKKEMKCSSHKNNHMYASDSIGIQLRTLLSPSFELREFTNQQVKSLILFRMCYMFQGNLILVSQKSGVTIDSLLVYLSAPFLKEVLHGEALSFLTWILENQNLYNLQYPVKRKKYLEDLFHSFHQMNGNLIKLSKHSGHSISVLRTILSTRANMVLANQKDYQIEFILKRLKEQEQLYDDLMTAVENQILVHRNGISPTCKNLEISKFKVRKLIHDEIPKRNPVRGIMVNGVLSTLDS